MENNNNNQQNNDNNVWQPESNDNWANIANINNAPDPVENRPRRLTVRNIILLVIVAIAAVTLADIAWSRIGIGRGDSFTSVEFSTGDVSNIDVSLVNTMINVETHNGNNVLVVFNPPSRGRYNAPRYDHNAATGRLRVYEPRSNRRFGLFNFNIGVVGQANLTIYVPNNANFNNVNLRTTNGRVTVEGGGVRLSSEINIRTTNGALDARNFSADNLYMQTTNGAVSLTNVDAARDVTARSTNGRVGASGIDARNLTLRTTNGALTLDDSTIEDVLVARTTNGAITINNVAADANRAEIRTTNGRETINWAR